MLHKIIFTFDDAGIIAAVTALDSAVHFADNVLDQNTLERLASTIATSVPAEVFQYADEKLAEAQQISIEQTGPLSASITVSDPAPRGDANRTRETALPATVDRRDRLADWLG